MKNSATRPSSWMIHSIAKLTALQMQKKILRIFASAINGSPRVLPRQSAIAYVFKFFSNFLIIKFKDLGIEGTCLNSEKKTTSGGGDFIPRDQCEKVKSIWSYFWYWCWKFLIWIFILELSKHEPRPMLWNLPKPPTLRFNEPGMLRSRRGCPARHYWKSTRVFCYECWHLRGQKRWQSCAEYRWKTASIFWSQKSLSFFSSVNTICRLFDLL